MAIILPPAPLPLRRAQWRIGVPVQHNRSGWTGRSQKVYLPGATLWHVSGEFPAIPRPQQADPWIGFFMALRGIVNSFPLRASEGQQTTSSNPTVNGAGQTGTTLAISGSLTLRVGARVTIPLADGSVHLVALTAAAAITGSGTISFEPALHSAAQNGGTIEARFPYALVCMEAPETGWDVETGQIYGFAFSAVEDY